MECKLTIEMKRIRFIAFILSVLTIIFVCSEVYAQKLGSLPKKAHKIEDTKPAKQVKTVSKQVSNAASKSNTNTHNARKFPTGSNTNTKVNTNHNNKNNRTGKKATAAKNNSSINHTPKPKPQKIFEADCSYVSFSASGGEKVINIKSKGGMWSISKGNSFNWCKVSKNGNQIIITADENNYTSPRSDSFRIAQGHKTIEVHIHQDESSVNLNAPSNGLLSQFVNEMADGSEYLTVSTNHITFPAEGGVREVMVSSNKKWNTFFDLAFGTLLKEAGKVVIIVGKNDGNKRYDFFEIRTKDRSHKIYISQEASNKNISTNRLEYDATGGTQYVILSDNQWYLSSSNNPSWIKTEKDNGVLVVTLEPNKSHVSRTHSLIVTINGKKGIVNIVQKGKQANSDKTSVSNPDKRFRVGLELMGDFNRIWDKSWTLSWSTGILMKVGNINDVVNFSTGVRFSMMSYYAYYDPYTLGSYITIPVNLKFNTFKVGSGKFYIGAGYEYGFGLKGLDNIMDFNVGIGIQTRHIDWYLFAKDYFKYGDSIKWYFEKRQWRAGTAIAYYF